ncbi:hypothetical protein P2318_14060 [Myxococcaceae bacterium GXIMD 01537]
MIGSLVTMMALGAAPALTQAQVKDVTLQVPAEWTRSVVDGSSKFVEPSGEAYFLVDVGAVQTEAMSGKTCLDKILASIGGQWKRIKVGSAPAATRKVKDTSEDGKLSVETVSYVGCDGKTTWSVTFYIDLSKRQEYAALATKVGQSVKYARAGGK